MARTKHPQQQYLQRLLHHRRLGDRPARRAPPRGAPPTTHPTPLERPHPAPPASSPARAPASSPAAPSTPERIPAVRDLAFDCPREGCNTPLFLKENIRKDRSDYPACRRFSTGDCAWTGLLIKYPGKVCWVCGTEFSIGQPVWAYRIPDVEAPACYVNFCLRIDDYLLKRSDDDVPVNVRIAGEDNAGKRCCSCNCDDPTIVDEDQLVARSSSPFHIGCAVKARHEFEERVNKDADDRKESSSAKKQARSTLEKESKKPRQALPAGVQIDFS